MDITERIQMLLSKARHPSTINQRLEIRAEIQKLQNLREAEETATVHRIDPDTRT